MIKYLKYQDKKLPVRISYYALKRVKAEMEIDITKINEGDFEFQEALLWFSLERGHKMTDTPFEYDRKRDLEDIMDEVFFDFIKLIPQFFPAGIAGGKKTETEKK